MLGFSVLEALHPTEPRKMIGQNYKSNVIDSIIVSPVLNQRVLCDRPPPADPRQVDPQ